MTEIKNNTGIGQIQIADEVISVISATAAMEIEGVYGMTGNFTDIAEILGRKNFSKGIKVLVEETQVSIDINISVKFGFKIQEVSLEVQKRVKTAIENMTGLNVSVVNVYVSGIQTEKENKKEHVKNMDNE